MEKKDLKVLLVVKVLQELLDLMVNQENKELLDLKYIVIIAIMTYL